MDGRLRLRLTIDDILEYDLTGILALLHLVDDDEKKRKNY